MGCSGVRLEVEGLLVGDSPESLSKALYPLFSTGRLEIIRHDRKIVDWDVKHQHKQKKQQKLIFKSKER